MCEHFAHSCAKVNHIIAQTWRAITPHTQPMIIDHEMLNEGPVAPRLKVLRERAGLSVRDLADALEMPSSTYASYERTYKKHFLPVEMAQKLALVLKGMGYPQIQEYEVLTLAGVISAPSGLPPLPPPPAEDAPPRYGISVPEYDVVPQGGYGAEMPELNGNGEHPVIATWTIPPDYLRAFVSEPASLRIVRVAGDSMEPDYPAGERVMVDTSHRSPSPPGVYVLWDGFGLVLKRLEVILGSSPPRLRISSINTSGYPPYERTLEEVQINGRVVGKWTWR